MPPFCNPIWIKEFSVVRNEFEIGENNPERILRERALSTAYLWHNYGNSTIGSKEDVERVKQTGFALFMKKNIISRIMLH